MESGKILPLSISDYYKDESIPLEKRVRMFTKALVIFIAKLQSGQVAFAPDEPANMLATMQNLIKRIGEHTRYVDNVYYNYFLDRVYQYNLLFLDVADAAVASAEDVLPDPSVLLQNLAKLKLTPIKHVFVGSSYNTNLVYRYGNPKDAPGFSEAVKARHKDGIERIFYDEAQADDDYQNTGDTFEAAYSKNCSAISLGKQKTNIFSFLRPAGTTQSADSFWRPRDKETQKIEKRLFRSAKTKLSQGEELTPEELHVFGWGEFHRSSGSSVVHENYDYVRHSEETIKHFHAGHGSQDIDMGMLVVSVDPAYYNSGSDKRHIEAGKTTRDCFAHVVCFTSDRVDHLDEQTVKEAYTGLDPLFVAPAAVAELLRAWGFKHVAELKSWNDFIEIEVNSYDGSAKDKLTIYALPARNPSHREMNPVKSDINVSLTMGFMFHREGAEHLTLVTGDTAVLDDKKHMKPLEAFLIRKKLRIFSACIAAGSDRPRSLFNDKRQSTADAVTFGAKLNVINVNVLMSAVKSHSQIDKVKLSVMKDVLCGAIFYLHDSFRFGLSSHNDVEGTLIRMQLVLAHYQPNETLEDVIANLELHQQSIDAFMIGVADESQKKSINNFIFVIMDEFERKGLINTLKIYQSALGECLVGEVAFLLRENVYLPKSGELIRFFHSERFEPEYHRLIVNCDNSHTSERAYEYVIRHVNRKFFDILEGRDDGFRNRQLVKFLFNIYQEKSSYKLQNKKDGVKNYIAGLAEMKEEDVVSSLAFLQGEIKEWKTANEVQRDEGHFETIILIAYGLLKNLEFRDKFIEDCKVAHPELIVTRPRH